MCQAQYISRHCGAEHDGLVLFRQCFCNQEDVIAETHIEHSVCFVKDKKRNSAQVDIAQTQMADETTRSGNHHICSTLHGSLLLLISNAIVSTINCHTADVFKIVGKALHRTVNLLCKLTSRGHDDAIDGILRIAAIGQFAQYRQKIGSSLASTRLSDTHYIPAFKDRRDGVLLYGSRIGEVHVVERIEDIIIEV